MVLYNTCLRLIQRGRTEGLEEKIDVFYAAGKLTKEQYDALIAALHPTTEETTEEA
jgi:hypothetical protein